MDVALRRGVLAGRVFIARHFADCAGGVFFFRLHQHGARRNATDARAFSQHSDGRACLLAAFRRALCARGALEQLGHTDAEKSRVANYASRKKIASTRYHFSFPDLPLIFLRVLATFS